MYSSRRFFVELHSPPGAELSEFRLHLSGVLVALILNIPLGEGFIAFLPYSTKCPPS